MTRRICDKEQAHERTATRAKERICAIGNVEKVSKIFHLLADEGRLKIVLALLEGEMCVYHLTEVCGGTQSGVSHQLRLLRENKIVQARRMGKCVEYSIADEHVRAIVEAGVTHLQRCMEE